MATVPQALAPWFCMHGVGLTEISIGILILSVLLKHSSKIQSIVFAQKSEQKNENDPVNLTKTTATYVPMEPLPKRQDVSKRLCSTSASSTIGDLRKNYCASLYGTGNRREQQVIVLVCDNDDDGNLNTFMSLKDRVAVRRWRRKVHDEFDYLCAEYGVIKLPTKRSSYIVVSKLRSLSFPDQTIQITRFAIACQEKLHCLVPLMKLDSNDNILLSSIRFGMHMGASLAMVDDLENDAANQQSFIQVLDRATTMQKTSLPGQIHLSKSVAKHFKSIGLEPCLDRRTDGRLVVATYWLVSRCYEDGPQCDTDAIFKFCSHAV